MCERSGGRPRTIIDKRTAEAPGVTLLSDAQTQRIDIVSQLRELACRYRQSPPGIQGAIGRFLLGEMQLAALRAQAQKEDTWARANGRQLYTGSLDPLDGMVICGMAVEGVGVPSYAAVVPK